MEVIVIASAHNKFHFLEMLFIADVVNYSLSVVHLEAPVFIILPDITFRE